MFKKHLQISNVHLYVQGLNSSLSPINLSIDNVATQAGHILLTPFSENTLFLQVHSEAKRSLVIKLLNEELFNQQNNEQQVAHSFVFGGLVALSIAVFALFLSNGLKSILFLFGYFSTRAMLASVFLGGNLFFIFPDLPELRGIDLPIVTAASAIFLLLFTCELFELKNNFFSLYKYIKRYIWLLLLAAISSLFLALNINILISIFIHGSITFLLTLLGIYLIKKQQPLAWLYTIAVTLQLAFFTVGIIATHFYQVTEIENKALFYGVSFWLNAFLILFMLSRQYFYKLADKQEFQQKALESEIASRQANEELLALQQDHQDELEQKVQERTLELNIALQELEESNRELEEKNTLDDLSGLYNRRFYDQKILAEHRRSKRNLTPLSLVIIDIDHFKSVNDSYGHLAGDHCISWVGQQIKDCLKRSTDLGCRYGGEEFCLILPNTDALGAVALAEKLTVKLSEASLSYQNIAIELTISCGVSTYQQQHEITSDELFSVADKALYRAKQNGRNQVQQHIFTDNE
jgi:diguanylate cyclase (GGDEF)-like protein